MCASVQLVEHQQKDL